MAKKAELVVDDRKLQVSNLDKVLYPKAGFTKSRRDRLLHPDRAGAFAALKGPPAHNEALSRWRGRSVFL